MKRIAERVRNLPLHERRNLLKLLGVALGAPFVPAGLRYAANELAVGEAYAQGRAAAEGTLFLELNLRTQVDLMHVMVPPSIARYPNKSVGVNGEELCLFAPQSELTEFPNNVFLTNDSRELAPHIDTVAMLDTGEAAIGGVHGLEAGNGLRSPGRIMDGGASGKPPMYLIDAPTEGSNGASSEKLFSTSPTPATFHNYRQKQLEPTLKNGFAFKGFDIWKHSCYHYGAGLPGAELDRFRLKPELFEAFPTVETRTLLGSAEQAQLLHDILAAVDSRHLGELYAESVVTQHLGELEGARELLYTPPSAEPLELTEAQAAYWSQGVPPQQCTLGDFYVEECRDAISLDPFENDGLVKAQIWEQFAYASKIFRAGLTRSIALEFSFGHLDGNGSRPESVQRAIAQQVARPLSRFITELKAAGLYDRTVIAVYTLDGSRTPAAESYGNSGKGTILLAGGRIRGGYYGDIQITSDLPAGGHTYAFRAPDPATGELLPSVHDWTDPTQRSSSGSIWRTVVKAMGIPESEYVGHFDPLIDEGRAFDFMLRG